MTRTSRLALLVATLAALSAGAALRAAAEPAGFAFLEVPAGARASAMGGAFASVAEGAEAAFWNPAGLAGARELEISGTHYEFFQNLRHDQFAVAGRWLGGGLSGGVRAMYSGAIVERDAEGNEIGSFGGHDLEFALAYGHSVAEGVRVGGSAQVVRERIADEAVTTYAFGGGATWDPPVAEGLRLSLSAHNLGPSARYEFDGARGEPVSLPAAVQLGGSYGRGLGSGLELRGALETRITKGRPAVAMLGAELAHPVGAAIRLGLRANDEASSFSIGVGYSLQSLRLDYAFVPYRLDLGDTHRFSFATTF